MEKQILATLENYDGLSAEMVEEMKKMKYEPGMPFLVKSIEPTSDGSYKVSVCVDGLGKGAVIKLNAENVKLYKEYEDFDYKLFNPLEDSDFKPLKEKGTG